MAKEEIKQLIPKFFNVIPEELEPGILYVSMKYSTAIHLCVCGCGQRVVTPFAPNEWKLHFDGSVTIRPSIGNFNFACQSHYFITENKIEWCEEYCEKGRNRKDNKSKKKKSSRKKSIWSLLFGKI